MMEDHVAMVYRARSETAKWNLARLRVMCWANIPDSLSYFSPQELEDMESVEREGD